MSTTTTDTGTTDTSAAALATADTGTAATAAAADPALAKADPANAAPVVVQATGSFTHYRDLILDGAGLIYHDVVGVTKAIENWRSDNPATEPLFTTAMDYITGLAPFFGISLPEGALIVRGIGSALKQMAAADASLQSGTQKDFVPPPVPVQEGST